MIEALGVPHTEVESILVNGEGADFARRLADDDEVDVYPVGGAQPAHCPALRSPAPQRFVADAHLGQLARLLRMLGFDALYSNEYDDAEVAGIALRQRRIVLTRDRDLLFRREIEHGCFVHAQKGDAQAAEVLLRFDLRDRARPLSLCLECNVGLMPASAQGLLRVPAQSRAAHVGFRECPVCARVYWEGSHVVRMRSRVQALLEAAQGPKRQNVSNVELPQGVSGIARGPVR